MVIGYPTGGSNDIYARAVARHIGKHIPGNPTVIPRNMPGGGSLVAANHVFNIAPKDGTTLSLIAPTIPLEERLGVAERQAQERRIQLDRPRGAVGQHDLRDGDGAGEDDPGHVQARDPARRQRALVDGRDLSGGVRQRDRRQVQAGDGLSELDGFDAGDGARRGRRPFDQPRSRARDPSGMAAGEEDHAAGAIFAQASSGAAGRADDLGARPQRGRPADPAHRRQCDRGRENDSVDARHARPTASRRCAALSTPP